MRTIETLLEDVRKRLVETGTRNRLIHVNRKAKRGNLLNIINEKSEDIFKILRTNNKKMRFAGKGTEEEEVELDRIVLEEIEDPDFDKSRFSDLILETSLTPDALRTRLLKLAKDARTAEEEQGINILYIAMGFLRWYEDGRSNVLRESPLILVPVELVRNIKTSTFDVLCRDDDIVTNLSLQERMKIDFGIELPEIDDSKDWTPTDYFNAVSDAVSGKNRWSVDSDGIQLGFFSFAKLMMLRDLDPKNWDQKKLLANDLVTRLLSDGFESEPTLFHEGVNLDEALQPANIFHVVDADSSQTKVIEEVRAGRNIVVQGPPGTGKSQTITNILAAAAFDNKKVIFVAEKMAALDVVYNRMCKVGLKDLCLVLHSRSANKKDFYQELAETIADSKGVESTKLDADELTQVRDELNDASNTLHKNIAHRDYSPFQVLSSLVAFTSKNSPAPKFDASKLESISFPTENTIFNLLRDYLQIIRQYGYSKNNPFLGTMNLDLQPTDLQRLKDELGELIPILTGWKEFQIALETQLVSEPIFTIESALNCRSIYQKLQHAPESCSVYIEVVQENIHDPRFMNALDLGLNWSDQKVKMKDIVNEVMWTSEIEHLRPLIMKGVGSWFARVFGKYRNASTELGSFLKNDLPNEPSERLKLLDTLIEGQQKKKLFDEESEFLKGVLRSTWIGDRTDFTKIVEVKNWLESASKDLLEFSSEKLKALVNHEITLGFDVSSFDVRLNTLIASIKKIEDRLQLEKISTSLVQKLSLDELEVLMLDLYNNVEKYNTWTEYQVAKNRLNDAGLEQLVEMIDLNTITPDNAESELKYALSEARWEFSRKSRPELSELAKLDRHKLASRFSLLEKSRIKKVQQLIFEKHMAQVPRGSAGEMGLIRGEIAKKKRHRPIRQMMQHASEMIQRIKPIFFMSPISVAQFLPPGEIEFDLLVIDEASQVKPEDALGSIARAKQIVVVGDQKQLPPTSFFDRLSEYEETPEDDDEEELSVTRATEMESILTLCEARGLNECMLEWHYRSRDPSLIAVSNLEFYRNRLVLPPCPTQADSNFGLKLSQVAGAYSTATKGGGRPTTNRIEAESIADRLSELAKSRPEFSVGIVTFSKSQADMVTEVLESRRRNDETLDHFLRENKTENVFVKNIENVQGDERDIILISIGYGPHEPSGKLTSMNFGPINSEGGERRLNVIFSRSRIACEVFCSFDPSDMNLSRTTKEGPAVLKTFLEYAKTGELSEIYVSEGDADSPFEVDVAEVIRGLNYNVDYQVGTAGFKIDLGVKDPSNPDHYILAVECDGATYHSALWARERDRLRQEILEGFGWNFHRIWSTDWFYRRDNEIRRLEEALERAKSRDLSRSLKGSNIGGVIELIEDSVVQERRFVILEDPVIDVPKYEKANPIVGTNYEPHERPGSQTLQILLEIVATEGPIHTDEVARRYASAHGKSRVGSRINDHVLTGLKIAVKQGDLLKRGSFWGSIDQFHNVPVRDRSDETMPTTKAEYIAADEIIACSKLVEKECGTVDLDEMIRVIAKTLGFKRAGPDFQSLVKKALSKK